MFWNKDRVKVAGLFENNKESPIKGDFILFLS